MENGGQAMAKEPTSPGRKNGRDLLVGEIDFKRRSAAQYDLLGDSAPRTSADEERNSARSSDGSRVGASGIGETHQDSPQ
jgi:hypothetical protein